MRGHITLVNLARSPRGCSRKIHRQHDHPAVKLAALGPNFKMQKK